MSNALFRLESLLEFADRLVDLLTLELATLERSLEATRADLEVCRQEQAAVLDHLAGPGSPDAAVLATAYAYLDRLREKAAALEACAAELEAAICRKREELLAAQKEHKMVLKLKAEFEAAWRAGLRRREQQFLDEQAGGGWLRRHREAGP